MSKIAIEGNALGTGTLTIAAPNTNTNRTITLPDATGTIDRLNRAGNVLQVVSATSTTSTTTTSGSFVDSGLSLSITPTSATSKILVFVNQHIRVSRNNEAGFGIRLVRDSTAIFTRASTDNAGVYLFAGASDDIDFRSQPVIVFLDSPATTSATTYKTQIAAFLSGDVTAQNVSVPSTITLMEIAA